MNSHRAVKEWNEKRQKPGRMRWYLPVWRWICALSRRALRVSRFMFLGVCFLCMAGGLAGYKNIGIGRSGEDFAGEVFNQLKGCA